jgi:hypothetical protein
MKLSTSAKFLHVWISKYRDYSNNYKFFRLVFLVTGIAALIWVVVRVLPKPSRAQYPCMQVAAPLAGGFLAYIAGLAVTLFSFKKAGQYLHTARYIPALILLLVGLTAVLFTTLNSGRESYAFSVMGDSLFVPTDPANSPLGTATGIFPGRVTWMWDPAATSWNGSSGTWWSDSNTNQTVVDSMLSNSLRALAGKSDDAQAWDALFKYFNERHGKDPTGYQAGEKIAIKINLNLINSTANPGNISFPSPHMVLALLRQLVQQAGVAAADITFYDSNRIVPNAILTKCKNEFPDVHFMGWSALTDREKYVRDTTYVHWSEKLIMELTGGHTAYLPTVVTEAAYIISMANFKAHRYMGVTFCAKNHFGTFSADYPDGSPYSNAPHAVGLHPYTAVHDIIIQDSPEWSFYGRPMGTYNTLVDLMGHKDIGLKTVLFMIDALYGVESEQAPVSTNSKWQTAPFNNDWTSSLFLSQDNIAIESVGLDFYRTEQAVNPSMIYVYGAVDNYLHEGSQAGSPPSGTVYDPEGDGTHLQSLGVHEHWNNSADKQYSRNLQSGEGIELVQVHNLPTSIQNGEKIVANFILHQNYPNPSNPITTINYEILVPGFISLKVYDDLGREIATLVNEVKLAGIYRVQFNAHNLPSGVYFYKLTAGQFTASKKLVVLK